MLVTMLVLSNNTATAKIVDSWIAGRDVTASQFAAPSNPNPAGALYQGGTVKGVNNVLSLNLLDKAVTPGEFVLKEGLPFIFNGEPYNIYVQGKTNPTVTSNVITDGARYSFTAPCTGKAVVYIHFNHDYSKKQIPLYVSAGASPIGYTLDGNAYTSGDKPTSNIVSAAKLEFSIAEDMEYVIGVGGSKMMLLGVIIMDEADDIPTITATSAVDMSLNSYTIKKTTPNAITISGKNLADGEYDIKIIPEGDCGLTINPTNFTVTGGALSTTKFELTYAKNEATDPLTRKVVFTKHEKAAGYTEVSGITEVTLGKTAQRGLTELTPVTEQTTWNWTNAGTAEVKLIAKDSEGNYTTTIPSKDDNYFILGNIAEINNDADFNSGALEMIGEYGVRKSSFATASKIRFKSEKSGTVKVAFSNTSNRDDTDASKRYLAINGQQKPYYSISASSSSTEEIEVTPDANGYIELSGMTNVGGLTYLQFYSITFTPEPDAAPSIVTDLDDKYYGFVDAPVQIEAAFSGATSYKWYKCDDLLGTNPVEIPGQTTATCVYTPTEAGNTYIKCVAHNKKGDTETKVTTVSARVNSDEAFGIGTEITAENSIYNNNLLPVIPANAHLVISSPVKNNKGYNYFNYYSADNQNVYQGSSTAVLGKLVPSSNAADSEGQERTATTQTGATTGAEDLGAYIGFNVTVDAGYKMSLSGISLDMYAQSATYGYEFIIEDAGGNQLYKSPAPYSITSATTSTSNLINFVPFTSADLSNLSNLKGTFKVKMVWWCASGKKYIAIKNFSVKGVVEEITEDLASPVITTNVPNTSITDSEPAKPLNVTVAGDHYKTIQWYKNTVNSNTGGVRIDGQNKETLTYAPTSAEKNTTLYFYAVLNNPDAEGEKYATTNVVKVNVGARKDCKLTSLTLSNGFSAFIEMKANTVEAYYMQGEAEPTIESYEVSGGATYNYNKVGNTITVTAEDGTTTKTYEYLCEAVEPLTKAGLQTMSNTPPAWVKGGHWHNSDPFVYEAWKHTADYIANGYNRTYFFVGPCELLRIDVGSNSRFAKGGKGTLTTYINGEKTQTEVTLPAVGEYINIPCSMEHNTMIEIVNLSTTNEWGFLTVQQDKKLHLTYSKGSDPEVKGEAPASLEMPSIGANFTTPQTNYSLYKPGYTMTGWTDGENNYDFNTNYVLTEDKTLTPIWKKNGMEAEDVNSLEAKWFFGMKNNGGIYVPTMNLNGTTGVTYYVSQQKLNGVATDMAMTIQNGLFENLNTNMVENATVGTGTEFTVKAVAGATLEVRAAYNNYSVTVLNNGSEIGSMSHEEEGGKHYWRYTIPGDWEGDKATLKFTFNGAEAKDGKIYYLKVTYPTKTASDLDIIYGKSNIKLDYRDPEKSTYQLTKDIDYTTRSDGELEYLSSDPAIASVDATGLITAHTGGDVTISIIQKATATYAGGRLDFAVNVPFPATLRFFNGTTLVDDSKYTDTGEPIGNGKIPAAPSAPAGKNFVGWYTTANGSGVKATPYTIINEPTDFYALFMDVPQLVDGFYQLGLEGNENPGQRGDKLVNAITWATRQAPADEAHRIKIWIPNGIYNLRELTCTEVRSYISLIGESQNGVVIQNQPEREGLHSTATLKVTGNQVVMQNLTLKNVIEDDAETTDPETKQTYQRGVCLEDCGTGNVYREVRLLGRQNTYYASKAAVSSYFENSELHGTIDMVGGDGSVWFEECQLKIEQNAAAYIAAPETTGEAKGFIFNGCTISNADGASMAAKYYLGHGLTANAKVGFYNTTKSIAYKETGWGQSEPGASTSDNANAHSSTAKATLGDFVDNADKLAEPTGVKVSGGNVTWTAVPNASGYVLYNGGERIKFLTTNSYALPQGAATSGYTVATISGTGIIGDAATETTAPVITKDLVASQECYVGKPLNLAITATGGSITYQWYKSPTRGSYVIVADEANAIPDATSASFPYTAVAEGDAWFCCKATNTQGDTYSTVTMVTAKNPVITQDLRSIYNVQNGSTKELAIAAEGAADYQWYTCSSATDPEAGKTAIPNATSPLLAYQPTDNSTTYIYCKVNGCVNSAITSLISSENAGSASKTYHEDTTVKEFYDFKTFTANGAPTLTMNANAHEQTGTNAHTVYEINSPTNNSGTLDLNGRFAIDYGPSAGVNKRWMWRTDATNFKCGLCGNWNSKGTEQGSYNLSVLGLYPGDKVTIVYAIQSSKSAQLKACSAGKVDGVSAEGILTSGVTYTVSGTAGANDNIQLDLYSIDNNLGIHSILVESHWYATAEPVIGTQPVATCKTYAEVPHFLSIDATDANTYQWYVNSTAEKNGATAIEGATSNTLFYTPERRGNDERIDYVFCVVGNDNGYKSSSFCAVTVDPSETVTLDFVNRPDDDNVLVLGAEHLPKTNVPLYHVVNPYEYTGYMAAGGDYKLNNGLTNTSTGGDRPVRILGLGEGDIVTVQGNGFKYYDAAKGQDRWMTIVGSNAVYDYLADDFATIRMTSAGDLTFTIWRGSLVHIHSIIVKKKPVSSITTNLNEKYFVNKGGAQTLTVASDGGTDTYQWYSNTVKSNKGGVAIADATSTTYNVPATENGTTYYYCVVKNASGTVTVSNVAQVDVADVIFRDFELDVRQKRDYGLTTDEVSNKSAVEFGVIVNEDGTLTRVAATDPSANVVVSGTYENTTLGLKNATFTVPVQGKVKFSVGRTDNADANLYGNVVVKDANDKVVTTLSTKGGKWSSNKKNIDYGYYSGAATTLTFTTDKYVPYFRIEAVEVSASEAPTMTRGIYNVAEHMWEYTMTTNADGATIYYTTDGSVPTTASSSVANGGVALIPAGATVKAYAVCDDWYDSDVSTLVAPAAPAAKATEMISYHNGVTGDNVGTSYTVVVENNGGQPAVFDDGLKFNTTSITYENNTDATSGNAFRINVIPGYRITGISVKGLGNDAAVNVTGIYADLADIATATNYLTGAPVELPASGEGVEFSSNALMSAEKYVDIMTSAVGVANLQVTVNYEYADEVTGITINGSALTAEQVTQFNSGNLDYTEAIAGNPVIIATTKLGFTYPLAKGDGNFYTLDMIGGQKKITLTSVLKALPVITIDESKFYFGERDGEGNVTHRGYDFTVTGEEGGTIMVSIDGATAVAYTEGMRAIESVEAYYTNGGLYPDTHVTANASSTDYSKSKPFAAYVYKSGYDDNCGDIEPLNAKMIIDGIGKTYNVVPVLSTAADPANAEQKANLDAADLVVLTEAMGSGDAPFNYVDNTSNTVASDVHLPNNVLNLKLFAAGAKKAWKWHSDGATNLDGKPVTITPANPNNSVFNGVAFNDDANHTITLWDNPVDRVHLQGLSSTGYTTKGQGLGLTTLATNSTFDILQYFENNNHTFVQFGLSINDYRHYNDNVKTIVSNICEMINAGTPLNKVATKAELATPTITDNGNGTATIRTTVPLATIKYVALTPSDPIVPDAEYIKANGETINGQKTSQYATKKKIYAVAVYEDKTTAVAGPVEVSGSQIFKVTRTAETADDVTGVDVTNDYDSSEELTVPYNQSFKKPGYSVKAWHGSDGRDYIPGANFDLEQDLVLTAVWEENHKSVADFIGAAGEQRTATFQFLPKKGAPRYEIDKSDAHGVLVGQVRFSNELSDFIDVVADISMRPNTVNPIDKATYGGKFWNTYTNSLDWFSGDGSKQLEYCQIKTGTVFTFPAVYGMTVNFKAIDLEQDNLLNVHRTYVTASTLTDGTLLNPGCEYNYGTGEYSLVGDNYSEGGQFEYSGKTMTAELLVRESSIIHSRATEDASKATVLTGDYGWNNGSCFMDNFSVTYPVLYSVIPTLNPEMSTVAIGEPTANITYVPEPPKNTNGKFTAGMDVKMVVTPTYAQMYNKVSEVPAGVTVATEGDGVPEDGAVYTFQMPDENMLFTIKMIEQQTRKINSSPMPRDAGRIVYTPDYNSFVDGKTVTLTANPKVGYQFVKWTTDDEGKTPVAGAGYTMVDRDLTFTVGVGTGTPTYYAQFTKGIEGTVHYLLNHSVLLDADGIVEPGHEDFNLTTDEHAQTEGFPGSITESAMIIPTYYTMYKEGYTLDHWVACNSNGTTVGPATEYNIGSYYYFTEDDKDRYIKPVFRKNKTNFDYRTTEVDITWDFRTAYFAQSMDYDSNRSEIHYSTHSTINRPTDATGQVTMDVPLVISTGEFGKMNNQTLDEWCTIGEGTKIQIPSGLDATFTLAAFAPITSTKIDGDVLKTYTKRTENDVDVYVYTYRTKSTKTFVTLSIGDDFSYYKYLRAQLPSAEKVAVNTSINVPYMGSVELVSTGTKPDGEDLDIFDVTEETADEGSKNYMAPLGSYVTVVAKRNRLYEFDKWVDGNGDEVVADGKNIFITTDIDAETGGVTSKLIYRLLEYVTDFKAIYRDRPQYQINYTAGPVATGIAPPVTIIEKGESFTLPQNNQVLYLEGHTLKYWLDEQGNKYDFGHTYTPGKTFNPDGTLPSGTAAFIVPDGDVLLSPVFLPNEFSLGDILEDVTVTWPLAKAEGATSINYHKSSGVLVSQMEYDGMSIDLPLEMISLGAGNTAFNGTDDNYCAISSGMLIGVPASPGFKIILNSYEEDVTTTEIGRYRGELNSLEEREKGGATYVTGTEIAGSTSKTIGSLTAGAYTAGLSPEVTCTNEPAYGALDILFKGDATMFTSIKAVYTAISIPMPELEEVSVGGVKLGSGIYGKYSVVDLNSDKELNNIRVNAVGEKLPEVKATTVGGLGTVSITQATVADPRATIILKTANGIVAGVYVLNFKVGRVTGTPRLTGVRFYRKDVVPNGEGVYECDGVVAPNSVMELTFDRVMAEKTMVTARDIAFADGLSGRLDEEITATENQTLKFTFWNLDMGKEYKFRIKANTLEDVYGNPYTEDLWFHFTVSNRTMQNTRKAPYNFVVTHKEEFDHSRGNTLTAQRTMEKTQVATDELIANLDAAGIPYGTIDEAVAAANADASGTGFFIFVPDGEYQIGGNNPINPKRDFSDNPTGTTVSKDDFPYSNGQTFITRPGGRVSIIGQSMDKTVIYNKPYFFGISYTSTLELKREASDCYFQDLSFDNRYSWYQMQAGQGPGGQSVAFYDRAKRTILKNVGVYGFQDSYASAPSDALAEADRMGRNYYEDCTFAGTVDFICGEGDIWWERCKLLMRHRSSNNLCAPRTLDYQKWGYIFSNCTIDAEDEAKTHAYMNGGWGHSYEQTLAINSNFTIGRPWDYSPAATYLNTRMVLQPASVGWASMKDEGLTLRFQEYGSVAANGEAIDLSVRTTCISTPGPGSYDAVMSPSAVKRYNIHNVLGGDEGYDPTVYTEQRPAVTPGFDDTELSWRDDADALLYAIFKSDKEDGEYKLFAITTSTVYDCGESAGWYKVRAANQRGGLGEWSKAVQYVPVDRYLLTLNQTKSGASECRDDDNNPVGWSTICLPFNAKVPEKDINDNPVAENFKVYAAVKIQDNTITLKRVHYITSNVGYVVYGFPGQYLFKGSSHNAMEYDGYESLLNGNPSDQNISAAGTNCYTLSYKPAVAGIGFYKYVGSYLNSKKAYLTVDVFTTENEKNSTTSPSAALQNANAKGIRFVFEDFDDPTGIYDAESADDADSADDVIYDLMGRRLRHQDMRPGNIYIINGQSVKK